MPRPNTRELPPETAACLSRPPCPRRPPGGNPVGAAPPARLVYLLSIHKTTNHCAHMF